MRGSAGGGVFKRLTEQEDGVLIAGMALLFPTAFAFYLGVKVVFAAYRDYRRWREEQNARVAQEREAARAKGREEGHAEGRDAERSRVQWELQERGISPPPEAEHILYGETDDGS